MEFGREEVTNGSAFPGGCINFYILRTHAQLQEETDIFRGAATDQQGGLIRPLDLATVTRIIVFQLVTDFGDHRGIKRGRQ